MGQVDEGQQPRGKPRWQEKREKEQELRLMFREIFVCFGTAVRHTLINHRDKSEKAWRELGDRVWEFAQALEED